MKKNGEEFDKLQQEWYAKLKEEGFKDIESPNGDLRIPSKKAYMTAKQDGRESYYQLASEWYWIKKAEEDARMERFVKRLRTELEIWYLYVNESMLPAAIAIELEVPIGKVRSTLDLYKREFKEWAKEQHETSDNR